MGCRRQTKAEPPPRGSKWPRPECNAPARVAMQGAVPSALRGSSPCSEERRREGSQSPMGRPSPQWGVARAASRQMGRNAGA